MESQVILCFSSLPSEMNDEKDTRLLIFLNDYQVGLLYISEQNAFKDNVSLSGDCLEHFHVRVRTLYDHDCCGQ